MTPRDDRELVEEFLREHPPRLRVPRQEATGSKSRANRLTTAERAAWGAVGAAVARSRHDPRDLTASARIAFAGKFEAQIRAEFPELTDEAEIARRAHELRRAHMARLSALAIRARYGHK